MLILGTNASSFRTPCAQLCVRVAWSPHYNRGGTLSLRVALGLTFEILHLAGPHSCQINEESQPLLALFIPPFAYAARIVADILRPQRLHHTSRWSECQRNIHVSFTPPSCSLNDSDRRMVRFVRCP